MTSIDRKRSGVTLMCRCNRFLMDSPNRFSKSNNSSKPLNTHFDPLNPLIKAVLSQMSIHHEAQMVFKKLVLYIYNLIQLRGQPLRIKDAAPLKIITVDVSKNAESASFESPTTSNSSLDAEPPEIRDAGEQCCVCLSRLKEGAEELRVLPCLHKFHKVCVDRWFNVCRKTCPVCRSLVGEGKMSCKKEEELTEDMVTWFSSFHVAGF